MVDSDDPVKLKLGVFVVENLNTLSDDGLLLLPPNEKPVLVLVCALLPKLKAKSGFFGAGAPSALADEEAAASEPKPLENAEEEPNVGMAFALVLLLVGATAGADAAPVGAPNRIEEPNTGAELAEPNILLDPVGPTADAVVFDPKIVDVAEGAPNDGIADGAAAAIGFTSPICCCCCCCC